LDLTREIENANRSGDETRSNRALSGLISSFSKWVESNRVPEEILLGKRHAFIDWWPSEMVQYVNNDPSPQGQAQFEMNNHILDCLDLIRLATISSPEFLSHWEDSNEPFFAAGRLIYGRFQWIREISDHISREDIGSAELLDRVGQFTREYVGLLRLALLAGAESPLLERVSFVLRRFKVQYAAEIPVWQGLARELLDGTADLPTYTALPEPAQYGDLDSICDRLRQNLVDATTGLESEIPALIDALLPTLRVPASAELFAGNLET
jgi:hypothetical protein